MLNKNYIMLNIVNKLNKIISRKCKLKKKQLLVKLVKLD